MVAGDLRTLVCVPCRGGEPALTETEIAAFAGQTPEWALVNREGIFQLERVFKFKNFADALAFTNRVAALAEAENHHPALLTEWGRVTVTWWTHVVKGLHRNDFILAVKTGDLYAGTGEGQ